MYLSSRLLVFSSLATLILAQSSSCTGQQYNDLPGFPASNSGCYPTNYYQTYDLGNTNPDDARVRCEQYCTSDGDKCKSVVAQVNKAADSNLYSGTCFLFAPGQTVTPRQCANTAYLLEGYYKDSTNTCFSASSSSASKYCSSYLGIPTITSTITSTPPVTTVTITTTTKPVVQVTSTAITTPTSTVSATVTTTITVATNTQVVTATVTSSQVQTITVTSIVETTNYPPSKRRRAVATIPPPACVTSNTPATRISAACSCLSVKTSTTTTTKTLSQVTSTSTSTVTSPVTTTNTVTVTAPPVTTTVTVTVTSSATATMTTTTTTVTTTTSTATSVVTVLVPQCYPGPVSVANFPFQQSFNRYCNTQCVTGGAINQQLGSTNVGDFNGCLVYCTQFATITVAEYYEPDGSCSCYFTSGNTLNSGKPGYDCGVVPGRGVSGG